MESKKLEFRENMLLEAFDPDSEKFYKTTIQEVNNNTLSIGAPMSHGRQMVMSRGDNVEFRLLESDALYYFNSRIIDRNINDQIPLYIIERPTSTRRQQRRRFFRYTCHMDVNYWLLAEPEDGKELQPFPRDSFVFKHLLENAVKKKGLSIDLSGGGTLLMCDKKLKTGSLLALELQLSSRRKKKNLLVQGRVLRSNRVQTDGKKRFYHGVEFLDIDEKTRDDIINYIFILMRERMQ